MDKLVLRDMVRVASVNFDIDGGFDDDRNCSNLDVLL